MECLCDKFRPAFFRYLRENVQKQQRLRLNVCSDGQDILPLYMCCVSLKRKAGLGENAGILQIFDFYASQVFCQRNPELIV